jgi:hypothetical protein
MERNWLIRTTQNQILGPVAKAKVIEFLEKGALGTNDEVASGNGYWFSLKEKDLVEKYLYGDVPQGYNPISESKSVLSKRENPDKTTSLNTAPANKTQVLKASDLAEGVLPKNEDLEYPDITLISAAPKPGAHLNPTAQSHNDEMKLPDQSDLEFPDITMMRSSTPQTSSDHGGMQTHVAENRPIEIKSRPEEKMPAASASSVSPEDVVYPEDDDLAYPDMMSATPVHKAEAVLHSTESAPVPKPAPVTKPAVKAGMRDLKNDFDDDPGLTLVMETIPKEQVVKEEKPEPVITLARKEKPKEARAQTHEPIEDKKLLHERKVKASAQVHKEKDHKDHQDEPAHEPPPRSMPEELKKRNDNYLLYILAILVLIIFALFFYYYRTILNKPLPV